MSRETLLKKIVVCRLLRADHPYFAGLQAHPEFCTRPLNPSPAFLGFIAAAAGVLPEQVERQKNYTPPVSSKSLPLSLILSETNLSILDSTLNLT